MAKFDEAFKKVVYYEGGYVNDPDDAGGETYMGITRKNHSKLLMWNTIDKLKKKYTKASDITKALKKDESVTAEVKNVYKKSYWDIFNLDSCTSAKVAYQIFDTAVNMGATKANSIMNRLKGLKNLWK